MGRTLPMYCDHGNVIDWGDFGPGDDSEPPECADCERLRPRVVRESALRGFVCEGNGCFYTSATCGKGHHHAPAVERTVVTVQLVEETP